MAWNDEFSDSSLNIDKWDFQIGNGVNGWGNNELQFYTSSQNNYELSEGLLKIVPLYNPLMNNLTHPQNLLPRTNLVLNHLESYR
jgi:hypothetical protein